MVVAHEGNLSAAAKKLGTTQPNLGRQMTALENELNINLFSRHSRGILLTQNGLEFLKATQSVLTNLQHEVDAIKQTSNSLNGSFTIMGDIAVHDKIIKALFLFSELYPLVECKFVNNTDLSLLENGMVDVSVAPALLLKTPNIIEHPLLDVSVRLYASQRYIETTFIPKSIEHLSGHKLIVGLCDQGTIDKSFNYHLSDKAVVPPTKVSMGMLYQALRSGLGIGPFFPSQLVGEDVLVDVFPDLPDHMIPYYMTHHVRMERSPKIKAFYECLKQVVAFSESPDNQATTY